MSEEPNLVKFKRIVYNLYKPAIDEYVIWINPFQVVSITEDEYKRGTHICMVSGAPFIVDADLETTKRRLGMWSKC